jgi:hypothetical protein
MIKTAICIFTVLIFSTTQTLADSTKGAAMEKLEILINGQSITLKSPPVRKDGHWLVPLEAFSEQIGAKVEYPEGANMAAICGTGGDASGGELCVQLRFGDGAKGAFRLDGIAYAMPTAIVEPFGFQVHTPSTNRIEIVRGNGMVGIENAIGHLAPELTLPDLDGKPRRFSDFRGKKTLFYVWASW